MPALQESRFGFLFRPEAFLAGFVLLAVLNALIAWTSPLEENPLDIRLISVFVYSVLCWFTHKKQLVATWVISILMLLSGISALSTSFLNLLAGTEGQIGMKLLNLFVGGYFSYGGLVIFMGRPRKGND